jgi:enamine deaminase RidA (YjgF/YER057c/UK114 family)
MTRRLISSGSDFEKTAGYSRAVAQGDGVFVSGTTGSDPMTKVMPENVEDQARNCFAAIERALVEAGSSLKDAVRVQYFVTNRADAERVFPIFGEFLGHIRPAAGLYIVSGLYRPEMKIEIELTALRQAAAF